MRASQEDALRLLIVGALLLLGTVYALTRPPPADPLPVRDEAAIQRREEAHRAEQQAATEAERRLREKVEPILTAMLERGVTREEIKAHLRAEIIDALDMDDLCRDYLEERNMNDIE